MLWVMFRAFVTNLGHVTNPEWVDVVHFAPATDGSELDLPELERAGTLSPDWKWS